MNCYLKSLIIAATLLSVPAPALSTECQKVTCANQLALEEIEMARILLRMNLGDWKMATADAVLESVRVFKNFEITDAYQRCARNGDGISCLELKDKLKTSIVSIFTAKGLYKPKNLFIRRARQTEANTPKGERRPVEPMLSPKEMDREEAAAARLKGVSDRLGQEVLDQIVIMETFDAERFMKSVWPAFDEATSGSAGAQRLSEAVIQAMNDYKAYVLALRIPRNR
jgi:hypothetical protein